MLLLLAELQEAKQLVLGSEHTAPKELGVSAVVLKPVGELIDAHFKVLLKELEQRDVETFWRLVTKRKAETNHKMNP